MRTSVKHQPWFLTWSECSVLAVVMVVMGGSHTQMPSTAVRPDELALADDAVVKRLRTECWVLPTRRAS